jgi:excisionase family DNA binding protein
MSTVDSHFRFLSVPEAARILGVSPGRVHQLLLAGILRGHRLGGKNWALDPVDVANRKLNTPPRGRPRRNNNADNGLRKSGKIRKSRVDKI